MLWRGREADGSWEALKLDRSTLQSHGLDLTRLGRQSLLELEGQPASTSEYRSGDVCTSLSSGPATAFVGGGGRVWRGCFVGEFNLLARVVKVAACCLMGGDK